MQALFSLNKWVVFGFLCVVSIILSFAMRELVVTFEVYYDAFSEQLTWERAEEKYQKRKEWAWVGYVLMPLLFAIKFLLVATSLYIGTYLHNLVLPFKKLFGVAVVAELVFLLPTFIKVCYFSFFNLQYTLQEVVYFAPWALSFWLGVDRETDKVVAYLLQVSNLVELLYFFLLSAGLQQVSNQSYFYALRLVLQSYGVGLFVWVVFIAFLIVSLF